jgi:cytosine deaminase
VQERARALAERAAAFGTTRMRCHVDIDNEVGLAGVEELLELRETLRARLDVQLVAFPQSGILSSPGTAELMKAAVRAGVEVIGGLDPAGIDGDVAGHLDVVFGLAERLGAPVDLHLHDQGELGAFELLEIARRTQALGLGGRVTVSHAYALGELDETSLAKTASALAQAGVAIMTTAPGATAMPPVKRLLAEGVLVFTGSDNVRDAWSPLGNGDMLERTAIVAYRQGLATDPDLALAFSMATDRAAAALGLDSDYGLREGAVADLVAVRASGIPEAVAAHPPRELVLKGGSVVARSGRLT